MKIYIKTWKCLIEIEIKIIKLYKNIPIFLCDIRSVRNDKICLCMPGLNVVGVKIQLFHIFFFCLLTGSSGHSSNGW